MLAWLRSSVGLLIALLVDQVQRRPVGSQVLEHPSCGSPSHLGGAHQLGDGGQLPMPGVVMARGGAGLEEIFFQLSGAEWAGEEET